ncbi:DUF1643 domain-containing protein [Exiguobacterium flavidum]|uniref:DUF1643 domain-containing protein n=1 Tax=Exiguobacterium flavidum TaxID=2184695 RepID=UPI000DF7C123|nr:DUF1643 domain-containing protein [Exiguobacterium flavidum]
MQHPNPSEVEIEETRIEVDTVFDKSRTKRYLRSYVFTDIMDGTHVAAMIYTPRTSDAFLSGTTTQRAYNLLKKHVDKPIARYDIISLMPDLAASDDLPFAQAKFDETNFHYVASVLEDVKAHGGIVLCGWGSPGRLMHHLPQYEELFAKYADILFCTGVTAKGEPNHLRLSIEDSPMITYAELNAKAKKLRRH